MNDEQFKQFSTLLQDTNSIIQDEEKRREVYYAFDNVFTHLNSKQWQENNLAEAHQYSEDAVFQNTAEGYFRLGFLEKPFFQYSKLVYELWYEKTIEAQNKLNKRIHKGTQLHQIASIHEFFSEYQKHGITIWLVLLRMFWMVEIMRNNKGIDRFEDLICLPTT